HDGVHCEEEGLRCVRGGKGVVLIRPRLKQTGEVFDECIGSEGTEWLQIGRTTDGDEVGTETRRRPLEDVRRHRSCQISTSVRSCKEEGLEDERMDLELAILEMLQSMLESSNERVLGEGNQDDGDDSVEHRHRVSSDCTRSIRITNLIVIAEESLQGVGNAEGEESSDHQKRNGNESDRQILPSCHCGGEERRRGKERGGGGGCRWRGRCAATDVSDWRRSPFIGGLLPLLLFTFRVDLVSDRKGDREDEQ
ncbi:hypothetical protein PMAYCL1PPCAC_02622, partial [Pristionchus mayeri]